MTSATAKDIARSTPLLAQGVEIVNDPATGFVKVRGPVFKRGIFGRTLSKYFKLTERVEVELDEIGSWVIHQIDGRNNMERLADRLSEHLKLTYRESEAALTIFIRALLRRKLLHIEINEVST